MPSPAGSLGSVTWSRLLLQQRLAYIGNRTKSADDLQPKLFILRDHLHGETQRRCSSLW